MAPEEDTAEASSDHEVEQGQCEGSGAS